MNAPSSLVARAAGTSLLIALSTLLATRAADAQPRADADAPSTRWADSQTTLGFAANGAFFDRTYVLAGDTVERADLYLTLRPRFRVHPMLQLRAYWDFDVELTNSDTTTTRNEIQVSDPTLALWFDGIPALGGLRTSVAAALTAPLSERSRADTMILATSLLAQAHWSAPFARGTFRAIGRLGWHHWFHQYTTPGVRGDLRYARTTTTGSDGSQQLRGITSVHDEFAWNLTITQAWEVLSPGVSFGMFHQWPYDVATATIGPSIGVSAGSETRVYSDFAFWLDVMPLSGLTVEAGYSLTRSIRDGDGSLGNPFYDRFQNWRVYLSVTFAFDRLFDGRTHNERGIVRW